MKKLILGWEKIRAEPVLSLLIGVLVLLLGTFLVVLFCESAEKYIVQLYRGI